MPDYREPAAPEMTQVTLDEFHKVVTSRRSVKRFTEEAIPDAVLQDCLDMALLAPNSSNLQPWEFVVIRSEGKKQQAAKICMNQNAAKTAQVLIAVVARTDNWQQHCDDVLAAWPEQPVPPIVKRYYQQSSPFNFMRGPLNVLAPVKWGAIRAGRLLSKKAIPETHYRLATIKLWATKSTALAAENLMLAFRAHGFDSCPMEGFEEGAMKKFLGLGSHQHIIMMIGAGRRADDGIYHPQFRLPRERFIREI